MTRERAAVLARLIVKDWRATYNREPDCTITDTVTGHVIHTRTATDIEIVSNRMDFYERNPDLFRNFVHRMWPYAATDRAVYDLLTDATVWLDANCPTT